GGPQAGELLVLEQRRDRWMVDLLQLPRPRRRRWQARPTQGAQHVRRGVGVQGGVTELAAQDLSERLEPGRAESLGRARAERVCEEAVVDIGPPGQASER